MQTTTPGKKPVVIEYAKTEAIRNLARLVETNAPGARKMVAVALRLPLFEGDGKALLALKKLEGLASRLDEYAERNGFGPAAGGAESKGVGKIVKAIGGKPLPVQATHLLVLLWGLLLGGSQDFAGLFASMTRLMKYSPLHYTVVYHDFLRAMGHDAATRGKASAMREFVNSLVDDLDGAAVRAASESAGPPKTWSPAIRQKHLC
jgi:hypothetical protein